MFEEWTFPFPTVPFQPIWIFHNYNPLTWIVALGMVNSLLDFEIENESED